MTSFFSSLADKAQSALKDTPLGQHLPGAQNADAGKDGQGGLLKSHTFETIQHQFRTIQQQYSSTTPVQRIITAQKGVALDFDGVARDTHAHSKELYLWSQHEREDLKDVADRLAWINFIEGSLASTYAQKLNQSRAPFKALRDAENALAPRRAVRASYRTQIARIEHDQPRGLENRLAELKRQLDKAEADDEPHEKEIAILKRKALGESEQAKWAAVREYGEKLVLLSQAASAVIPSLPAIPPAQGQYTGAQKTMEVRASLQHALDNYSPGDVFLDLRPMSAADLSRSDTRSFGETHAQELSRINTAEPASSHSSIPVTPPATASTGSMPPPAPSHGSNHAISPPLNPAVLNQAPAPIPIPKNPSPTAAAPDPTDPSVKVPSITPTVAETGVPVSAGADGPGPANGSLKDLKPGSPQASRSLIAGQDTKGPYGAPSELPGYGAGASGSGATDFESAEDEKRRLEREERERILREGGSGASGVDAPSPHYESAEDEKKRLEREERERLLRAGTGPSEGGHPPPSENPRPDDDGELPPYQEFGV
ncbi:hypothetical protein CERSUDRAFT_42326 [Gelatoporia subvermispora B]|uniref:Sphingolipid long chain base-responsive protein LSP1 n=1 Tax=Ceriporiopsis subvermispora (strain B) TaxID=914234 RepID=M2PZ50_CERS8|nr:hypothetical protein CERSUDRAFT_42326 [Gelatoporia subvermispora B]